MIAVLAQVNVKMAVNAVVKLVVIASMKMKTRLLKMIEIMIVVTPTSSKVTFLSKISNLAWDF
ncbi:MAG: hypothetical protein J4F36_08190 [Nitrosopumilaceae archaeon]|nr:hypothetical protein [Nitrosopumilaceae archaeon]